MAIFPILELESAVQINDKTRLDGSKSFIPKGEPAITLVRIKPEAAGSFVTVSGVSLTSKDWYLDWVYETSGAKVASIEITTNASPTVKNFDINILSVASDNLFSTDKDIMKYEHDVLKYVRPGRSSWLDFHRKAQDIILNWIDEKGYTDTSGARLTKASVVDVQEVKEWSTALTLSLIYTTISNSKDDIFAAKAIKYDSLMKDFRSRAVLRLDVDGDGTIDAGEYLNVSTARMLRR